MGVRAVVLVLVVVLAGCSAGIPESLGTGSDATASAAGTATVDRDNPWRERTLTVAVDAPHGDDRDYRALVRRALDYWETNAEQYAGYPVSFRLVDDRDEADVVVEFVREVTGCDDIEEAAGCAPHITASTQIDRPEAVEVRTGLSDVSTVLVVKHELGHVLGLGHQDAPQSVMAATTELATLPQPNATERSFPWSSSTLAVYVNYSGVPAAEYEQVREQIRHALAYYERGADGHVPANVSFVLVDNRSRADVVVTFPERLPCGGTSGSCGSRAGADPDRDGAPEWYTSVEIAVSDVDAEAVGWHVGYWLGYGLGFTEPDDWPAVFRNASASERRSEWWRDGAAARPSATSARVTPRTRPPT